MCGIAGFWDSSASLNTETLRRRVERMTAMLAHRGPDAQGVWCDAEAGVGLGHTRLSILDLSEDGSQPMRSHCGRFIISFNGEIYNYQQLGAELVSHGHCFRGTSDTEVMLAAIVEWGVDGALERFNGMFAFALWDVRNRQLHLARDRAGEKPLYYGLQGRTLVFGSELKALRAYPDFHAEIDRGAMALYMRHSYIAAPHTIYQGIYKLPAGAIVTLTADHAQTLPPPRQFWRLRDVAQRGMDNPFSESSEEAVSQLDLLLRDSIKMRMASDVPLGAFLSGGIDSSTVVALMQAQSTRRIQTFTIGFHDPAFNEAEQAGLVAKRLGTDHTEFYVTPADAMSVIPRLASIYDEPFADSSQIPTILLSRLARGHVTVGLSGDGGDELFGGYARYHWAREIWRRAGWAPHVVRKLAAGILTGASVEQWDGALRRLNGWAPSAIQQRPGEKLHKLADLLREGSPQSMYLALVSQCGDPSSIILGAHEPSTMLNDANQWISRSDLMQHMMYADTATYLTDDILVKMDRASMSVGLEARVPLLDHRLIDFAWSLPQSLLVRKKQGKWLLRQVLDKYVPKNLIDRPKMGFAVPIDSWLRGPLRGWAEDLLGENRLRSEGFFNTDAVRTKWREHLGGGRNWQPVLWNVLMFQAWLDEIQKPAQAEGGNLVTASRSTEVGPS